MSKRVFGVNETLVLAALLGLLTSLVMRFLDPELLNLSYFNTRIGAFLLGCFFTYFTLNEFKAAKDSDEWRSSRLAGAVRVPLYLAATLFLFFVAARGGVNA